MQPFYLEKYVLNDRHVRSQARVLHATVSFIDWIASQNKLGCISTIHPTWFFSEFSIELILDFQKDPRHRFAISENAFNTYIRYVRRSPASMSYDNFSDLIRFNGHLFHAP